MSFIDEAKITIKSGSGGDGMKHFRKEKYVPRGGPDGGDGGRGGNVVLVATVHLNTLSRFSREHHFEADSGKRGDIQNMTGKSGRDLTIMVPVGTIVREAATGTLVADLTDDGQEFAIAKGGRGGHGNNWFVTSTNQATEMVERGEPGEERELTLELRLIADVGIVGAPNAGKSTLLSVVSNATPKIAAYPFTTLEPQLGVVRFESGADMIVADIPGLVEGAHMGIGLGHAFLRHIQRTRVLIHLLDGSAESPLADFTQINSELALFDENLAQKPQIVVLNKMDLPEAQERWPSVREKLEARGYTVMSMSGVTAQGTREVINKVREVISRLPAAKPMEGITVYSLPEDAGAFDITQDEHGTFHITGKRIERAAKMTYWEVDESAARFQRILEALGITKELEKRGVQPGDAVFIGEYELEWGE